VACLARARKRPYDNQATCGQLGQALAYQMPKPPPDAVAYDRVPDGLADNETRTSGGNLSPRSVRVR
jgi:hypothetical protein